MAKKLVLLHMHHPRLYAFLNALVNVFVKGLPCAFYFLITDSVHWSSNSKNILEIAADCFLNVIMFFMTIIMGMMGYLVLLATIQIIKLFACNYKRVNIHIHIFGIIIRLGRKKILESGDTESIKALRLYEKATEKRREKIRRGKDNAEERRRERDERDLQYAQEEYERQKRYAEGYKASAERNFKKAKEGGGIFTSAEEERRQGSKNEKNANWHNQQAAREEQKIEDLKRKLGK